MKNIFSIIYLQTNSMSGEKIAVGLIAITESEILFKVSKQKLGFASSLSGKDAIEHATFNFQLIEKNVAAANQEKKKELFSAGSAFTKEYLQYLKKYSKGLTLFDEPKPYAGPLEKKEFKQLFEELVGEWEETKKPAKKSVSFSGLIHKKLSNPIFHDKGDVNYKLTPEKISGLLLPQEVNLISKNGNILAAHAIDFTTSVEVITRHAYELEVLFKSLDALAKHAIGKSHKGSYYLLFNSPEKGSPQEKLLNTIKASKSDLMHIEEADILDELAVKLDKQGYDKFSLFENGIFSKG